jgi:hypothetical protein
MRALVVLIASCLLIAACKRTSEPAQQGAASDGAGAVQPAGDAGAATGGAYVTAVTVLKMEPVDASRIKGADGKEGSNFRALLYRGEQVQLLETKEEWVWARTSDDKEGWLKRTAVLEAAAVKEATFLAAEKVFDRPDLLASNSKRTLDPGTFVLVVKERPPFSEVNFSGGQNTWVLSERLATGPKDVAAAKLVEKARYLAKNKKMDEAVATLELLRTVAPESPLVEILAVELGVSPAAGQNTPEASAQPASAQGNDPLSPGAAAEQ